jgi:glycosyltransferase involved in cell wall biosynthesis
VNGALNVLFVSSLFPNSQQPAHGIFNLRQMQHLATLCKVRVVAPIPWFFIRGRLTPEGRVQASDVRGGLAIQHPRAFYLPVVGRTLNPWLYARSTRACVEQVRRDFRFDVIYANWAYPDACAVARTARWLGVPFVASISGSDANRYLDFRIRRRQILEMLSQAQAVTVRSLALSRLLVAHGVPETKVHVLYNGVDRRSFGRLPASEARRRLGLAADERVVLYLGRLSREKGVSDLLEALRLLRDEQRLTVRLVVSGDGVERERLSARAAALGIESTILWLGWKQPDDIGNVVAACDLVCLPSHMEGVPNAALEAFACGKPVVATRVGGIPEVLTNDCGVLADPRAPESLAAALDAALRRTWDAEVIRAYSTRFDWNENALRLREILNGAIAGYRRV